MNWFKRQSEDCEHCRAQVNSAPCHRTTLAPEWGAAGCTGSSTSVTGTVNPYPVVTTSSNTYLSSGQTAALVVQNVYTTYQWKKNGTNISGATTYSYTANAAGRYSVEVTLPGVTLESDYLYVAELSNTPETATVSYDNNAPASVGFAPRKNYVRSYTAKEPGLAESDFTYAEFNRTNVSMATQYFDGLGLAVQTVDRQASPVGNDVVVHQEYDVYGRVEKEYLPYSTSTTVDADGYRSNIRLEQYNFYRNGTAGVAQTGVPFAQTAFEPSPLDRALKKSSPGEAWKLGSGHEVKYDMRVLGSQDALVRYFSVNTSGELVQGGYYNFAELAVSEVRDENDQVVRTFTDKEGKTRLKRVKGDKDEWLDTYYVYDMTGNLRFVLPPQLIKELGAGTFVWSAHNNLVSALGYQYIYDARQRQIEKRVPGAGWVYMVYDTLDRVVLTQDASQRSNRQWMFTKYDVLGRPVMSGLYTHSDSVSREAMNGLISTTAFAEAYDDTEPHGYTTDIFPTTNLTVHTVTFYDSYAFRDDLAGNSYNFKHDHLAGQETVYSKRVRGLVTGTRTNILNTNEYLWAVNYYDSRYRVIQTIAQNHPAMGGNSLDRTTNIYDFTGQVTKTKTTHGTASASTDITRSFTYDDAGRPLKTYHKINNEDSVLLAQNEYNEAGQLVTKKLHSRDNGTSFKQPVNYRYNIRGWLTNINELAANNRFFSMELSYESGFEQQQYNGNITGMKWKNVVEGNQSAYGYVYDPLNRLKEAGYVVKNTSTEEWTESIGAYNEKLSYDGNGNILSLERTGKKDNDLIGEIDDLAYTYAGNQLLRVDDASAQLAGFKDGNTVGNDYEYDVNGSMTRDKNKGITSITYNHLNLPATVRKSGADSIVYTYDATGRKLKQQVYGAKPKTTDYAGEYIYENDTLKFISHEEGRLVPGPVPGPPTWEYQYHLKDHLGNVRMTFTSKHEVNTYTATLEAANEENESADFNPSYDNATVINSSLFNHTPSGSKAQRLSAANANEIVGLAKSLSVMPGDTVNIKVYGKYYTPTSTNSNAATMMLASIAQAFGVSALSGGEALTAYNRLDDMFGSGFFLGSEDWEDEDAPKAFLNYILFDKDFVPYDMGWDQIDADALETGTNVAHDELVLTAPITQPGYIYIYVSNENQKLVDVYFDDLTIEHKLSPVVQQDDYYAFGLTFNSYKRENSVQNKYLYNRGSERQDDLALDVYQTRYRILDQVLGRWWQLDPKPSDAISLYASMDNNPIRYNDPDGDCIPCALTALKALGNFLKGTLFGTNQRYQTEPRRGATVTGIRDTQAGRTSATTGKPAGAAVIRVDQAHPGTPTPHLNVNPNLTGVKDPHTPISPGTLKALGTAGKTIDAISSVAKPIAIVTDVVRIGAAVQADGGTIGNETIKTTASVAGGWTGAWAGASIVGTGGAKLGALIGTAIEPGGGTILGGAIGGFVGGLGGGIAGAFGGSWLAEKTAETVIENK